MLFLFVAFLFHFFTITQCKKWERKVVFVPPSEEGIDWNSTVFDPNPPINIKYIDIETEPAFKHQHEKNMTAFEQRVRDSLPENYDPRTKYGHCLSLKTILNQGQCGACWAFGSTGVAADRLCMAGVANFVPSAQYSLSCDRTCLQGTRQCNTGCQGGFMGAGCQFITQNMVTTEQCVRYTGREGTCPRTCNDGTPFTPNQTQWKGSEFRHLRNEDEIKVAIYTYGTVTAGFQVYSDFENYRSGVYRHRSGQHKGGHAIKIVGWGVEQGVKYWLCQNTWGTNWGDGGFFKFLRGENHCQMESEVWDVTFPEIPQPGDDPEPEPGPGPEPEPEPEPEPRPPFPPIPFPPRPVPPRPTPPQPEPPTPEPPQPEPPAPVPPEPEPPTPTPTPPSPTPEKIPCLHNGKEGVALALPSDVCPARNYSACITGSYCKDEERLRETLSGLLLDPSAGDCVKYAQAFMCAEAFPMVDKVGSTFPPCQNTCNWFVFRCRRFLEGNMTMPDCSTYPKEDIKPGVGTQCYSPLQ
ncbi:putative cathepsin B [Monocercomonoides exilis]|uniref:putative cathepsin B n=1 Tax=Monocercomonoides exilis TaxID=2049356 RepID=UPI00355A946A|nr:putative cathepsin B [Monocercomonoides exilis]|eukprot:MONOS_3907.1-p1 / transcript=MONOS_3907.1 / gene=MONOS_3907 / organism=Monocercomonoides_exilis_PA203 / gene_product=cathepsin B / transcript_product=cathepsin B / location=Mono_scaffold00097:1970-3538(-) / protein_length=522 / sequence_SO=supercontig / SO=protein_coding / is_pseudo=false